MITKLAILILTTPLAFGAIAQDPRKSEQPQNPRKERIEKFLNKHPDLKNKIEEFRKLTPEQRREKIQQKKAEFKALTPEQRKERAQEFKKNHPRAGKGMQFLRKHPGMKRHLMHRLGKLQKFGLVETR